MISKCSIISILALMVSQNVVLAAPIAPGALSADSSDIQANLKSNDINMDMSKGMDMGNMNMNMLRTSDSPKKDSADKKSSALSYSRPETDSEESATEGEGATKPNEVAYQKPGEPEINASGASEVSDEPKDDNELLSNEKVDDAEPKTDANEPLSDNAETKAEADEPVLGDAADELKPTAKPAFGFEGEKKTSCCGGAKSVQAKKPCMNSKKTPEVASSAPEEISESPKGSGATEPTETSEPMEGGTLPEDSPSKGESTPIEEDTPGADFEAPELETGAESPKYGTSAPDSATKPGAPSEGQTESPEEESEVGDSVGTDESENVPSTPKESTYSRPGDNESVPVDSTPSTGNTEPEEEEAKPETGKKGKGSYSVSPNPSAYGN